MMLFSCYQILAVCTLCTFLEGATTQVDSSPVEIDACVSSALPQNCTKTPIMLENMFIRACTEVLRMNSTCYDAWSEFRMAFAGRNPGNVTDGDYGAYFDVIPIKSSANQTLFWSRTPELVKIISMMNAMNVEVISSLNTPASLIFNLITDKNNGTLNWCGNETGIDFVNNCNCDVTSRFWFKFSKELAIAAKGNAFYLADGENCSFRNDSFFATAELPFLVRENVSRLVAFIVHREGKGDSCNESAGKIVELKQQVENRQFSFVCYDILGPAKLSESTEQQKEMVATCVKNVVKEIQQGVSREGVERRIQCSGATTLQVSLVLLLFSSILSSRL